MNIFIPFTYDIKRNSDVTKECHTIRVKFPHIYLFEK